MHSYGTERGVGRGRQLRKVHHIIVADDHATVNGENIHAATECIQVTMISPEKGSKWP